MEFHANEGKSVTIQAMGKTWARHAIATHFVTVGESYIDLMERYGVTRCYYGHLHGGSHRLAASGKHGGIEYHLVSADYLGFRPEKLVED